jgi:hypothetical protein
MFLNEHLIEGRLSTVDLLELTSLDHLLLIMDNIVTKQANLMRRSTVLSFPLQLVFSALVLYTALRHIA